MVAPTRKRANGVNNAEDTREQENVETINGVEEPPPKRIRKKTTIQQHIDNEKAAKEQSAYNKLRHKMKQMKAEMYELKKAQQADESDGDDDDDDLDKMPAESEEEDEDVSATVLQPSIRKNTTTPLHPAPKASIRRREGDLRPVHTPQPPRRADSPASQRCLLSSPARAPPSSPSPTREASSLQPPAVPTPVVPVTMLTTPAPTPMPAQPLTSPPPVQSSPAALSTELRPAPFRDGFKPIKNSRPNAGDYIDEVRDLLLLAIARYMVSIFTVNAFPDTVQQRNFVTSAWDQVCAAQESTVLWQLSDRMITVIGKRKSNARGDASDRIRPLIPDAYKFRTAINKSNEQHNTARSARLVENGIFHYKKFDLTTGTKTRFAQNKFIDTAVMAAYFWNAKSGVGFEYASHFNPMPDPAIAFVLTAIHAHILEWATGQRVQEQFTENANSGYYKGFLADLGTFGASKADAWLNVRKRLFERTFRAGGGVAMTPKATQVSQEAMAAATAEFAQCTGLTDSEGEGEEEE